MKIAIVVPTIRTTEPFKRAWAPLLEKHNAELVVVRDGDDPRVEHRDLEYTIRDIMESDTDLIARKNPAVRNLGFAFVYKFFPETEIIITLDDDVTPRGDTIADHLSALSMRVETEWLNTAVGFYPRGFPYEIRKEKPVVVSHGVWHGIPDLDAMTQLVDGIPTTQEYFKGVVPHRIYAPFCGMNVAFKKEVGDLMYWAPIARWDDIWLGIVMVRELAKRHLAWVTGYSAVNHNRASNVFNNIRLEAIGLEANEDIWQAPVSQWTGIEIPGMPNFFAEYIEKMERWKSWVLAQNQNN